MIRVSTVFAAAPALAPAAVFAKDLAGQEIHIGVAGPLTTPSATFGVEMRQAVDLAVDERNAAGGVLGGKVVAEVIDDQADAEKRKAVAKGLCDDPRVLAVVGPVNSGVWRARKFMPSVDCPS
jgi:branched-chain amino acid transport system substrate-binding protein